MLDVRHRQLEQRLAAPRRWVRIQALAASVALVGELPNAEAQARTARSGEAVTARQERVGRVEFMLAGYEFDLPRLHARLAADSLTLRELCDAVCAAWDADSWRFMDSTLAKYGLEQLCRRCAAGMLGVPSRSRAEDDRACFVCMACAHEMSRERLHARRKCQERTEI